MALQRRQLEIEVIEPARADRDAAELRAKGEAANILENGLAEIEVLKQKNEVWTIAGPNGKELLLIQMLPSLVEQITAMAKDIKLTTSPSSIPATAVRAVCRRSSTRSGRWLLRYSRASRPPPASIWPRSSPTRPTGRFRRRQGSVDLFYLYLSGLIVGGIAVGASLFGGTAMVWATACGRWLFCDCGCSSFLPSSLVWPGCLAAC